MKSVRIITSFAGAGIALAFTLALALPAQEPPAEKPPVEQVDDELRVVGEDEGDVSEVDAAAGRLKVEIETVIEEVKERFAEAGAEAEAAGEPETRRRAHSRSGGNAPSFFSRLVVGSGDYYEEAVSIMGSVLVEKGGEVGNAAVAIMGDTVVDGHVDGDAVAVLGNLTVNGVVEGGAVAILGDSIINGVVDGELVTVLGRVQLGPDAHIRGELVSVGGKIDRAPGSRVDGNIQEIAFLGDNYYAVDGLKTWIKRCLLMGRPLAFGANLGWAWGLALAALVCYFFIALLFPKAVVKCTETLETHPGLSIVAAVLSLLLAPILAIVLSVTVVGPILLGFFLFFASLFGKVVFFAWMGRRIALPLGIKMPAMAVLIGGVVTLFIYVVPVLGFVFQQIAGILGLGVVIYTLILAIQADRASRPKFTKAGGVGAPVVASTATAAAAFTGDGAAQSQVQDLPPVVPPVPGVDEPQASEATTGAVPEGSGPPPLRPEPPQPARPPQVAADDIQFSTLPRAGFWIRCAATLLDMLLIGVVLNVLETRMFSPADYFPLMAAAYFITFWALKGTTIGGVVCGLKIVRLDDRPVDWSVALIRGLGSFLSLFVAGLGFIWVAFDSEQQSWHDKIAGTTIVRVPRGISLI